MSSTKFAFFVPNGKPRWRAQPLIGWDIFYSFSNIAKWNSTKLDRKHDVNILYQVCVFQVDWKNKMAAPSLWLAETFSTSLKQLNRIQWNLLRSHISVSSTKFVLFQGPSENLRRPPCLIRQQRWHIVLRWKICGPLVPFFVLYLNLLLVSDRDMVWSIGSKQVRYYR